jgi:hypothetical protein
MENNRVFVSPGVYTSERDLTFVTNNVGVTTLGLVGETQKGPAFQPIYISNYGEMKSFFGGQNPEKYKDTGALRYELPYIAKSYLTNSNQLYVTRVLGFSGYYAGEAFIIEADGVMVAMLRSRGSYGGDEVLDFKATDVTISATPTVGADFTLTVTLADASTIDYTVSLDKTKKNYITRVFGKTTKDGKTPVFVDEIYQNYVDTLVGTEALTIVETTDYANYKSQYKSAKTPYIVSEFNGTEVKRLFRFETISDGDSANEDVKISITNIKPDDRRFDVEVRRFSDSDINPQILERYSKVTMDPTSNDFIGKRIGTTDGEFKAISSYVLVEMNIDEDTTDSYPAGFEGYVKRAGIATPELTYKTTYGEFENKRKKYLGLGENFDKDMLKFKGLDSDGNEFGEITKGFHMDKDADATLFVVGAHSFKNEEELVGTDYEKPVARKFTVAPAGGFDGWDVYRIGRTNSDDYTVQKAAAHFDAMALSDGDQGIKSDYYAFLEGVRTFSNPQEAKINVFATPGLDVFNNAGLVEYTIDMVERERGDSIYIVTTPDVSEGTKMTSQDVADRLMDNFDSNYTATYWPWIQKNDDENNVNVYLPPTCEVVKNIALTDNVAHPWFATAGYSRGNVNATKARLKLTQVDSEILYGNRINPITTFAGDGIKIMGNKNLQVADTALNRINVRRLLLRARGLVTDVGVKLLFEQNDDTIREEFLRQVNPILENIRKERGLHNFKVELSPISPEGRDRNTLSGRIRIQPTNALEYIDIAFDVTQNGGSFENV